MFGLSKKRLLEIYNTASMGPNQKDRFLSKWRSLVNFLYQNSGLSIAGVAKAGSVGKTTEYRRSDLDIIFGVHKYNPLYDFDQLYTKLSENYGKTATVQKGRRAVHVCFSGPRCEIDVVPMSAEEFQRQHGSTRTVRAAGDIRKTAIVLVKHAVEKAGIDIAGYEIEKASLLFECPDLCSGVESIVKYFRGRIGDVETVLQYLR